MLNGAFVSLAAVALIPFGCAAPSDPSPAGHPAHPATAEGPMPTVAFEPSFAPPPAQAKPAVAPDHLEHIRELPTAQQAAALMQKDCPVSGEPLGSMGKPLAVKADGRELFLCCKGCEDDFRAKSADILRKLGTEVRR